MKFCRVVVARSRQIAPGAVFLVALVITLAPALAQERVAHPILSVMLRSNGGVLGYKVYHEEHKSTYVAYLLPADMLLYRCQLTDKDHLEVDEAATPMTYLGRDGEPCRLASFVPDAAENIPRGLPPGTGSCPTCPGR